MPAGDMIDKSAESRGRGRWRQVPLLNFRGTELPADQADRGGLHISFDTGNLAGKSKSRV